MNERNCIFLRRWLRACDTSEISKLYWFQVSTYLCLKYIKFYFQNLGNGREDKNVRRWTTFGFEIEKNSILAKYIGIFFFTVRTKSSLSTSVFIYCTIYQILKTRFCVFWTQICRNWTKFLTWTCYFSQVSHALNWCSLETRNVYRLLRGIWNYSGQRKFIKISKI